MTRDHAERPRLHARGIFNLIREAVREFGEDKVPRLGAALAYYTVFSLAPMLIIIIAVAGLALGQREAAQEAVVGQLRGLVGQEGAEVIETAIESASEPSTSIVATVISVVTLLLGALGAFGQLQEALNTIWEVRPKPGGGVLTLIKDRLLSLGMVLVIAFFLLVSLAISAALAGLATFLGGLLPGASEVLLEVVNFAVSLGVITVLFALMFKLLPDAKIAWSDVWVGAAITALLFTIGKTLIGIYLGNASVTSSYGAAGSLVVLLLWVYYSAQILFFGAEITQVYANRFGARVMPKEGAEPVTEVEREQQGIPHTGERARQPEGATPATALTPRPESYTGLVAEPTPYLAERLTRGHGLTTAAAARKALLAHQAEPEPMEGRDYLMALLTFAAGLGAGTMVALNTHRRRAHPELADYHRRNNHKGRQRK